MPCHPELLPRVPSVSLFRGGDAGRGANKLQFSPWGTDKQWTRRVHTSHPSNALGDYKVTVSIVRGLLRLFDPIGGNGGQEGYDDRLADAMVGMEVSVRQEGMADRANGATDDEKTRMGKLRQALGSSLEEAERFLMDVGPKIRNGCYTNEGRSRGGKSARGCSVQSITCKLFRVGVRCILASLFFFHLCMAIGTG